VTRWCFRLAVIIVGAASVGGCATRVSDRAAKPSDGAAALALDLARTRPLGSGPAFRPAAIGNPIAAGGAPIGALRCSASPGRPYGAHIELFAGDRSIAVPAGIGIAQPQRRQGAVVAAGRCAYPLRTTDPTGVIEVDPEGLSGMPTVGQLFQLWGQRLSLHRLASFRAQGGARVLAFLDGRRWRRDPRAILLRRHAQIVLEVGPVVVPHPGYTFPPGL
jgi:hypothetical protein